MKYNSVQAFVQNPYFTISTDETCLGAFLVILNSVIIWIVTCLNPLRIDTLSYIHLFMAYLLLKKVPRKHISSRFSGNSEAFASELLENLEEMFPRYYMDSDVISKFKSSTTHGKVISVRGDLFFWCREFRMPCNYRKLTWLLRRDSAEIISWNSIKHLFSVFRRQINRF